jgi:Lrp/AsnC family leucine-responsive transcriptional regulator
MDEKDLQILKSIEELETTSTDVVSDATGIPISTVHYRLNNLREEGIIRNDRLDIDLDELGLDITVLVEVFLKGEQNHRESGQAIAEIEGVTKAFFTMGETDFVALDDVARTNSTFVISRELDSHYPLQQYSEETLEDELLE